MTEAFNEWWHSCVEEANNPYSADTPAYWSWAGWQAGVAAEREACAKVCEDMDVKYEGHFVRARLISEAIRARLSQCDRCGEVNPAEIHTCTPRAFTNVDDLIADLEKPEPVAWLDEEGFSWIPGELPDEWAAHCKPLYTAPPQREWQGLTRKQLLQIWGKPENFNDPMRFARAIEAKLKEKNT